ncbi:MAG: hypothetical protein IK016_08285 [Lachnospiraceae bacterium]|nr:hypothetical protein [Lachnospiraceae bacterium]
MAAALGRKIKGTGLTLVAVVIVFVTVLRPGNRHPSGDDWLGFAAAPVLAVIGIGFLLAKDEAGARGAKADEDTDRAVRQFRDHLKDFFGQPGNPENTPLQQNVTQFLWHRLYLRKRRLNDKGLSLRIQTERKTLKHILPLTQSGFFDGKYHVTDVKETVTGEELFLSADGTKELHRCRLPNAATYRLLHAERTEGDHIICPNCGAASTRENLLDGCDYCGTKFTIEDLGTRVSDFAGLPDYDVEKVNFDSVLHRYQRIIACVAGIPAFLYWGTTMYRGFLRAQLQAIDHDSFWMNLLHAAGQILVCVIFSLFLAGLFVAVALLLFYFLIAPGLLLKKRAALTAYPDKEELERLRENAVSNREAAEAIREHDPLFSLEGFLANAANQLAVIHFSDHEQDAAAFTESERTEAQIASCLPGYADVIDMTMHNMTLGKYEADELYQKIFLDAECRLLTYRDDIFREKTERISLRMIKKASCKTQSVCAPAFLMCEGCGASISLLAGRTCRSCGRGYHLSDTDWVIGHYSAS